MTHENSLREYGYTICSPISGSMKPLIRPNIDSAVFVPAKHIRKYDVVLYRINGQTIMHRVIGISGDICIIRGDNSNYTEKVPTCDIFGVMQGYYRGQHRYVSATGIGYRLFARCWVAFALLLPMAKKIRSFIRNLRKIQYLAVL